jgi:hypothetical protein
VVSARHSFAGPKLGSYEQLSARLTHHEAGFNRPTVDTVQLKQTKHDQW